MAHIFLLFFIFTTYLPAPVFGFGWILGIMGFALAKDRFPKIATAYVVCFFAILLYQLPWRENSPAARAVAGKPLTFERTKRTFLEAAAIQREKKGKKSVS